MAVFKPTDCRYLKPVKIFHTAQPLPNLTGPNQELQLDFAGPILDDFKK